MAEPKSRKVHINISLTQEALDLLGEEAARQDRSRSWLIEWAVKKVFSSSAEPVNSSLKWDRDGIPTGEPAP